MQILSILQPSEMGEDFFFDAETKVWQVNYPEPQETRPAVSTDTDNALKVGADGGAYIAKGDLYAHIMVQDNANQKIHLYRFPAGTTFKVENATLISSIDMVELNGEFDDVAIDGQVLTFTDVDTGLKLSVDLDALQKTGAMRGSNSVRAANHEGILTLSAIVVDSSENLLEETEQGLQVDAHRTYNDLLKKNITQQMFQPTGEGIEHWIGNKMVKIPTFILADSSGLELGRGVAHPVKVTPTADRVTVTSHISILNSRVQIGGVDKGSFLELSQNQIAELEFTLISGGDDGYGGYPDDSYGNDGYDDSGYDDGYTDDGYDDGSYPDDGYSVNTGSYSFSLRNNTANRLDVVIGEFNTIDLDVSVEGVNNVTIEDDHVSFDLAARIPEEVYLYASFVDDDGMSLDQSQLDELHNGGTKAKLRVEYQNYGDAPPLEVTVGDVTLWLSTESDSRVATFDVTLPSVPGFMHKYFKPEIEVASRNGVPINANDPYINPILVKAQTAIPDLTLECEGVPYTYKCVVDIWNGNLSYVYRVVDDGANPVITKGHRVKITTGGVLAGLELNYSHNDVWADDAVIATLGGSGVIEFIVPDLFEYSGTSTTLILYSEKDEKSISIAVDKLVQNASMDTSTDSWLGYHGDQWRGKVNTPYPATLVRIPQDDVASVFVYTGSQDGRLPPGALLAPKEIDVYTQVATPVDAMQKIAMWQPLTPTVIHDPTINGNSYRPVELRLKVCKKGQENNPELHRMVKFVRDGYRVEVTA